MQNKIERIRLNVGCGNQKIQGCINIDFEESCNPDKVINLKKDGLREFKDDSVEEILFFHVIEHLEEKYHDAILSEFWRVLRSQGILYISYPEFTKCAKNYISNHRGMREFWKNTIYGLQRYPGDYHVSLMDTDLFIDRLKAVGFDDIKIIEEPAEYYNTFIKAIKGKKPPNYEEIIEKELFG